MSDARQAGLGVLAALLSAVVIFGSMLLALTEGGQLVALLPTLTATSPAIPQLVTLMPGEPTYTPLATFLPTFTSTPVIPDYCPPPDGWLSIEIWPGATLEEIAAAYGSTPQLIMEGSCMSSATIWEGYLINVPALPPTATSTYTATSLPPTATRAPATARPSATCSPPPRSWVPYFVRRGDYLLAIARATGTTVARLKAANCLRSDVIHVGQRLYVPYVPTPTLPTASATTPPSLTPTLPVITTIAPSDTPVTPPTFTDTFTPTPTTEAPPSPTHTPEPPTAEPPTATPTLTLPPPPPATPTNTPFPTPAVQPTATATSGPVP